MLRDLSLMVKRMTFNHYHKGSSPLDLKKKKYMASTKVFFKAIIIIISHMCLLEDLLVWHVFITRIFK